MNQLRAAINSLFNWKQNPASVFFFAIPLALIGFGCLGAVAYFQWAMNGDLVYAGISLAGLILLVVALLPAYRMHRRLQGMRSPG
ncbi:hypothetical protein WJ96_06955 [Burkholderia ubonensis]|uniref:DUF4175 domain-containing protein n=1 Tax=Burkholderia ubonensis TaxID=101571 RepID=A0AAW3MXG7_9BURK|nr:hypothetical protein [Burkholderia ubonensis]KVP75442.1 hypothetical protein WJ93_08750 [Burkholderia ubonensis]KVP98255.1 hypothetical protein WJ96_06955 [Burkholderia ubonensis]KVZ92953.1 hypothetical protein WL25_18615 [Burkholderia ubonensis]